ncbi:putative MFS-type transporter [Cyphellophora attinorum]|uniref:Putative MFS-type transporter n=1 Tax=Cyphellophora attinorum TaxID=1664694 RepID=A0A0N0NLZ0_9EURO|nr:putative MFS-type transporter [Phialophora attinorum]KPI39738.1 putative MFS-type transporter [Phialophora attinorum]
MAPQPSDDPNDPLNFAFNKKLRIFVITGLGTCIWGATLGPLLNASLADISVQLQIPFTDAVIASGYQPLAVGCSIMPVNALARRWGKRPVFLVSGLLGIIGSAIGAAAANYHMLVAARLVQGLSGAAYESLALSMIGDLYFVHERGFYMSIMTFLLASVSNFGSILCGPITTHLGWKYLFNFLILFGGLQTLLQFLFVPETQFRRDHKYDIDETGKVEIEDVNAAPTGKELEPQVSVERLLAREPASALFGSSGVFTTLPVAFCLIMGGYFLSLYVIVAYLLAQFFSPPPYLFNASEVGYLFAGPFIGGLLASTVLSLVSDPIVKWCVRKNKGVYEPEYRLLLCPVGLVSVAGFIAWGYVVQQQGSYILAAFLHGMGLFGITFVLVTTSNYMLDSYRSMSSEIFLASMCVKNFLI